MHALNRILRDLRGIISMTRLPIVSLIFLYKPYRANVTHFHGFNAKICAVGLFAFFIFLLLFTIWQYLASVWCLCITLMTFQCAKKYLHATRLT